VAVTDNEHVRAGEVLARLDDRDYRTALALTESQVAAAQAQIANIEAQMAVQQAQVTQNEAQVEQAQAALAFGQEEAARYATLARKDAGSIQDSQRYTSQRMQQQATKKMAQATFLAAGRKLAVLKAQHESAEANLAQANAQRAQAELNLSNTIITAAQPGRIVQLSAGVGQYAQPGTNLSMFVPDEIWVTANFKETQLRAIRPGQAATIKMDVQPGRIIRGHVESVQPGSGTAFSLLPAENATGNYVKIVQRVPVKIALEAPPEKIALGPGMSVEPTVRINPEQTLLERLGAFL
jgi:membrane fusion protein (multidrug efflux system)